MIQKLGASILGISAVGMWIVFPWSQGYVSIMILLLAISLMWMGYLIPRSRIILMSIGFYIFMTGAFATYSNWLPQVRGEVPEDLEIAAGDIDSMDPAELAEMGEMIIFGRVTGGQPERCRCGKRPVRSLSYGFRNGETRSRTESDGCRRGHRRPCCDKGADPTGRQPI